MYRNVGFLAVFTEPKYFASAVRSIKAYLFRLLVRNVGSVDRVRVIRDSGPVQRDIVGVPSTCILGAFRPHRLGVVER